MKNVFILILSFLLIISISVKVFSDTGTVKEWEVYEIEMTAQKSYANPYVDGLPDNGKKLVSITFTGSSGKAAGMKYTIAGFWDGGNIWRVRFASPAAGEWSYVSTSKDPGLDGISGSISCTAWSEREKKQNPLRRGFIKVCETGERPGRYFEYADGTPFLWIGDTWWNWTKRGIRFESFKKLADDRSKKGFTVGQVFVAANGWGKISSLLNAEYDDVDIDHMQDVEKMFEYANEKGITVWVHGWWSRDNLNRTASPEKIRRWWRYLIDRLGAYNVIWVLAGEYNMYNYGDLGLEFWKDLGKMIKEEDPYERIVGTHPTPPTWKGGFEAPQWSTGEVLHSESWLDYNQSQTGHGKMNNEMASKIVTSDYKRVPPKPVVITEPWYEFILGNPPDEDIRLAAWSAVLSGAAGHTYGGGHVWKAHVPEAPAGKDSWPMDMSFETNTLDYPGAVSMGNMAKFFKRLKWWELEPHPELVEGYAQKYCSGIPGKELVIYVRWGGRIGINLNPSSESDIFEYTWYNPRTGEDEKTGTVNGGAVQYLYAPEGNRIHPPYSDWVLYFIKK